eukprot:m.205354 g.205354  ORF g.205354 m.205354 type:complete len:321 (-) comp25323_c2_seq2:300-1262(-)
MSISTVTYVTYVTVQEQITMSAAAPAKKEGLAALPGRMVISAMGGSVAATFCHPLDTLKVQMQVSGGVRYTSMADAAVQIVRREGMFRGLYAGISAAYMRQWTYGACRVGIFSQLMSMTGKDKDSVSFATKLGMGMVSGGIGAFVGTPAEMALVRMTADSKAPLAERKNYKHVFDCLARAAKTGGVRQMWAGADLTIARSMLLSSSMLASYSEIKGILHRAQPSMFPADGIVTMFCGTLIASVIANTVVNPVDVIKSRYQLRPSDYTGIVDCFRKSVQAEGMLVLYRGYVPAFIKLAPYTVISLIVTEQISIAVSGSSAV